MSVGVGDRAPGFSLPGPGGSTVSLSDYAGRPVVLVFYPGDDSPVCTKQLNAYNDGLDQFAALDAQVVGISAQDVASKEAFVAKHGFDFRCTSAPAARTPSTRRGADRSFHGH